MVLRAVFLDVGNTLLFEEPARFEIYAQAARARGCPIGGDDMRTLMRRANEELPAILDGAFRYTDPWLEAYIRQIFHGYLELAESELAAITRELFERFEDPATFRLFPGTRELLETLRARELTVGLISNWSVRLPRVLFATGLSEAVDLVVCSAIEGCEKPDPQIFRAALERAGASAEGALHAGDHPVNDTAAARAIGMHAVLVDHGGQAGAAESSEPRVRDLFELQTHILSLVA